MVKVLERLLNPTATIDPSTPPRQLGALFAYFLRQHKRSYALMLTFVAAVGIVDATIPTFIGRIAELVSSVRTKGFSFENRLELIVMMVIILFVKPTLFFVNASFLNQVISPGLSGLVRWQSHCHIARQSVSFFQSNLSGKVANRVMETGNSIRDVVIQSVDAGWYFIIFGLAAVWTQFSISWKVSIPLIIWFNLYGMLLWFFIPRLSEKSRFGSDKRSELSGKLVDIYSNIDSVKLFATQAHENEIIRDAIDQHTSALRSQAGLVSVYSTSLITLNAILIVSTSAIVLAEWDKGGVTVGQVTGAITLCWQVNNVASNIARSINSVFEAMGVIQDGIHSISSVPDIRDSPEARDLEVTRGQIEFQKVCFDHRLDTFSSPALNSISLRIAGGERVGLVGHSGAGKSTLLRLLLRFFDLREGRILIDGQDISLVKQHSLRSLISVVAQDPSLFHRSVRENIGYGNPVATQQMIECAARHARAHEFIVGLKDESGLQGYDARVGERGANLSGGQRQRVALARAILKNAPILILDEATSALDSELEAAIQDQLDELTKGRTLIVIAHRLSTVSKLDRLIVLSDGKIVEVGSHSELLLTGGLYSRLWNRQTRNANPAARDSADSA